MNTWSQSIRYVLKFLTNSSLLTCSMVNKHCKGLIQEYVNLVSCHANDVFEIGKAKRNINNNKLLHCMEYIVANNLFSTPELQKSTFCISPHMDMLSYSEFTVSNSTALGFEVVNVCYMHAQYGHYIHFKLFNDNYTNTRVILFAPIACSSLSNIWDGYAKVIWYSPPYFSSFTDKRLHFHSGGVKHPVPTTHRGATLQNILKDSTKLMFDFLDSDNQIS